MNAQSHHQIFVTIDGRGTNDIDDALSVESLSDGGYRVVVAIANPARHVAKNSSTDKAARDLAATIYVRDRPKTRMLPAKISEVLSSLVAGKPRDAIIFDIKMNKGLDVTDFSARLENITVDHRLAYEDIPAILANGSDHPARDTLLHASKLSTQLLHKRRKQGALALYDLTQLLSTDEEGNIRRHSSKEATIGHLMVQECMILANERAGLFMVEQGIPAIFRNHKKTVSAPASNDLADTIQNWISGGQFETEKVIASLRAMAGKADYGSELLGHYGLNLPIYTHITSPLRRYADLVNLRQISAHLNHQHFPYTQEQLREISAGLNETIERQKMERSEAYKAALTREVSRTLLRGGLRSLADNEMSASIKMSVASNEMVDPISEEIIHRLRTNTLAIALAERLILRTPHDLLSQDLKSALGTWLEAKPERSVSIFAIAMQIGSAANHKVSSQVSQGGFVALANGLLDGKGYEAQANGPQKRLAEQKASTNLMLSHLGLALIQEEEAQKVAQKPQAAGNPKGALLEWCQKHRVPPPVFEHKSQGPSHMPTFGVVVTLRLPSGDQVVTINDAMSKKDAEAQACALMRERISSHADTAGASAPPKPSQTGHGPVGNPIATLQEHTQAGKLPLPQYSFVNVGASSPEFECRVSVNFGGGTQEYLASGPSKQSAKAAAALAAMEGLETELASVHARPRMRG